MSSTATQPVLIVGAGPTGMTAAMELARCGVSVRLIEKALQPATTSRAIGVQARTLELFEQRGLAGAMLEAGNPVVAGVVHGGGHPLFRLDFAHVPSRYAFVLIISQAKTERILREELARLGVSIERGIELVTLGQTDPHATLSPIEGVSATLRHQDGSLEEVAAAYLISAEGAHSRVRSSLELQFAGRAFEEGYALGDITVEGDLPDDTMQVFSSGEGFMAMFPLGQRHFRLIVSNPIGDSKRGTDPTLAELQAVYDARSEIPAQFCDLTWSSWFRINSRMVAKLQHGRIFLGGDSAHIHSPAGGQGMNTGIQDMINLGWKLAMVVQGKATPELLTTYEEDRLPVIRGVLDHTETLTKAIGSENPLFRSVFNHVAPWIVRTEFVQRKGTAEASQTALGYRGSPLSTTHKHHGHLQGGDRIPDMALTVREPGSASESTGGPRRLFDLLDPTRWTLLVANGAGDPGGLDHIMTQLARWQPLMSVFEVGPPTDPAADPQFQAEVGLHPSLVLIRPDSYVGFVGGGDSTPQLVEYLGRWASARPSDD